MLKALILIVITILSGTLVQSQTKYKSDWESINSRPIPQWFQDAKFGIFIHWGLYSVPAWGPTKDVGIYEKYAEWYWYSLSNPRRESHQQFVDFHTRTYGQSFQYQDFVDRFTCEMFEPEEWANIFLSSGAKYIVLTSKHHEGFALWPSKHSWNWNAMDVGPHRDLAGELIHAVRAKGLRMGFYYSLYEWFNPLYHEDVNRYVDAHMLPQMKDLVNRYQPDVFWPDGEWDHPSEVWRSTEFLAWLYNDSPVKEKVVVNDRWGKETRSKRGGYYTTEYDLVHGDNASESTIDHPWEECRGIGTSFGFNRNEYLENYSTSEELVHILIDKVARGGNLLLNIGPTADGRIPVIMQQRLKDMGDWLAVNGEAIYGTHKWNAGPPITAESRVLYTTKGKDLYVICRSFPEESIVVKGVKRPEAVTMMGLNSTIATSYSENRLEIEPPVVTPADNPCDYAWVFKLTGALQ
jgi:alpha-L-fucosidase